MLMHIRGTNGSGKSTLVKALLGEETVEWSGTDTLPTPHYTASKDTAVVAVGLYRTACGGMDGIKTTSEAVHRCTQAARFWGADRLVLMEGILPSTVYSTWAQFGDVVKLAGIDYVAAFMSTPLEICLDRVRQRRVESGRPMEGFNPTLVENKYNQVRRVREKCIADGTTVIDLPYGNELEYVRSNYGSLLGL
jgi:energy-coupling factor transporter ATP-binding protein EcfA2